MIQIRFEEREKIGLQYILESLHGCSPFGQERIRRLRYYTPDEREELEQELRNVERAAAHAGELKDLYDQICVVLCQMKDIRGSLRRCRELEVPDHVELFELKAISSGWRPCAPCLKAAGHGGPDGPCLPRSGGGPGHPGPGKHPQPGLLHPRRRHAEAAGDPRRQKAGGGAAVPGPD